MTISWTPDLDSAGRPLYRALVHALRSDVDAGRLRAGARLPTQRELSDSLGIGLGTVTRAYKEAQRQGLIDSRVGNGSFIAGDGQRASNDPLGLPNSGLIEMSVDLPIHAEDPDLRVALRTIARRADVDQLLRYHAHAGTPRHRKAGAAWAQRFGLEAREQDVVVCAGTQHALTVTLMSCAGPGDVVLCDSLTYPGIKAVASHLHLRIAAIPMDAGGLQIDALAKAAKRQDVRALYCMPSLHNPTTTQIDTERRAAIAELARKHDFALLEDDVHRLLSATPPPPLATFAPERTYYIASFSKAVTGGLRVAFLIPPARAVERSSQAVWATVWMVPTLAVEVAATWIEDGTADAVVERKRAEAARRQELCRELLGSAHYDAQPNGYSIWLHLPNAWSSAEFAIEARRRGVAVTPSSAFVVGSSPAPPAVRVCLAAAETRMQMTAGLEILRELLATSPGHARPMP